MGAKLTLIKRNFDPQEITDLAGKIFSQKEIDLLSGQSSLFSEKRLIIIDNPAEFSFEKLNGDENLSLILKFSKTLPSSSLIIKNSLKYSPQITAFPEEKEQTIFPFLDNLAEKNPKGLLSLEALMREYGSQYLLTMIAFLLRRFVVTPKKLPEFVLKKIANQRKNFSPERIKELYLKTIETDFKIKSGILEEAMAVKLLTQEFLK